MGLPSNKTGILTRHKNRSLVEPPSAPKDDVLWAPHFHACPKCQNAYLVPQCGPVLTDRDSGFEQVQKCPECSWTGHEYAVELPRFDGEEHAPMRKRVQERALLPMGTR